MTRGNPVAGKPTRKGEKMGAFDSAKDAAETAALAAGVVGGIVGGLTGNTEMEGLTSAGDATSISRDISDAIDTGRDNPTTSDS